MTILEKVESCPGCGANCGDWNYDAQNCSACGYNRINPSVSPQATMRFTIGAQRKRITELETQLASLREAVLELGDCSCPTILYTEKMRCAVCQLKRKAQEGE